MGSYSKLTYKSNDEQSFKLNKNMKHFKNKLHWKFDIDGIVHCHRIDLIAFILSC